VGLRSRVMANGLELASLLEELRGQLASVHSEVSTLQATFDEEIRSCAKDLGNQLGTIETEHRRRDDTVDSSIAELRQEVGEIWAALGMTSQKTADIKVDTKGHANSCKKLVADVSPIKPLASPVAQYRADGVTRFVSAPSLAREKVSVLSSPYRDSRYRDGRREDNSRVGAALAWTALPRSGSAPLRKPSPVPRLKLPLNDCEKESHHLNVVEHKVFCQDIEDRLQCLVRDAECTLAQAQAEAHKGVWDHSSVTTSDTSARSGSEVDERMDKHTSSPPTPTPQRALCGSPVRTNSGSRVSQYSSSAAVPKAGIRNASRNGVSQSPKATVDAQAPMFPLDKQVYGPPAVLRQNRSGLPPGMHHPLHRAARIGSPPPVSARPVAVEGGGASITVPSITRQPSGVFPSSSPHRSSHHVPVFSPVSHPRPSPGQSYNSVPRVRVASDREASPSMPRVRAEMGASLMTNSSSRALSPNGP